MNSNFRQSASLLTAISREQILNSTGELLNPSTTRLHLREEELVNRFVATLNGAKPTLDFFSFYYELLENQASKHKNEQKDSDYDLFYIFFYLLLPKCKDPLTIILIRKLNGFIYNTTFIKGYCSERKWIARILRYMRDRSSNNTNEENELILTLIQILSLFYITPFELKLIFKEIQAPWAKPYWPFLMDIIHKMTMTRGGPDSYFDFNGKDSGIIVPMGGRLWPSRSYTFMCWVKIESFDDPSGKLGTSRHTKYQPRLFSFLTEDGSGVAAYFIDNHLHTYTNAPRKKPQVVLWRFTFEPKKWYFLCIVHEYHLMRKSEMYLYINGELVASQPQLYPKSIENLTRCYIGNNCETVEVSQDTRTQPLFGQIGDLILLEEGLYGPEVLKIYQLGPNMVPRSNTENTEYLFGQKGSMFIMEKRDVKVLFSYSPRAMTGVICLDTATASSLYMATCMEGVKKWCTKGIHETMYSIGGIKNLLLVFRVGEVQDPAPIFAIFYRLLAHSSSLFEEEIKFSSGFALLGYALEKIPPSSFNIDTIVTLESLAVAILKECGGDSPVFIDLMKYILFNFAIWYRTDLMVQTKLIQMITAICSEVASIVRSEIGLETFLDILKYFYWLHPETNNKLIIDTEMLKNRRMEDILPLRAVLIRVASIVSTDTLSTEEAQAIINTLRETPSPEQNQLLEIFSVPLLKFFEKTSEHATVEEFFQLWDSYPVKQPPKYVKKWSVPFYLSFTRHRIIKKYRALLNSLDPYDDSPNEDIFWKLDKTENSNRMRPRLKRDHRSLKHIGCAKDGSLEDMRPSSPSLEDSFVMVEKHTPPTSPPVTVDVSRSIYSWFEEDEEIISKSGRMNMYEVVISPGIKVSYLNTKPNEVYREGFLVKQGQKEKHWKTRFFVLHNSQLTYKMDGKVISTLPLEGSLLRKSVESSSTQYSFEILFPSRVLCLCAETRTEMIEWLRDLRYAIPNYLADPSVQRIGFEDFFISNVLSDDCLYKTECEMIQGMNAVHGVFQLTENKLYFFAQKGKYRYNSKKYMWGVEQIREVYRRTYLMRNSALELFLDDKTSIFINFPIDETPRALSKLISLHAPNLINFANISPEKLISKAKLTKKWQEREISNFQYLMALNTISGRTYNDLNQYPIFPWILKDYNSYFIDINNPAIYRDLSKPVGALNEKRLQQYIERYQIFDDPKIPKFMYGTHYSNAGSVLYYLMRLEPFTSNHAQLGGGKFDHPERMFTSLQRTWEGVLTHNNNVKELTPEFFYLPDFLRNNNKIHFGFLNDGQKVSDVILPPWASTPEEFISIHSQALESDYVSDHLHEWIDLIWGYKSRGEEAIKANNLFFYLTYPFDIDAIEDPVEKRSVEAQILNFGQCPTQIFVKAHPKRFSKSEVKRRQDRNKAQAMIETVSSIFHQFAANIEGGMMSPLRQGLNSSDSNETPELSSPPPIKVIELDKPDETVEQKISQVEKPEIQEPQNITSPPHTPQSKHHDNTWLTETLTSPISDGWGSLRRKSSPSPTHDPRKPLQLMKDNHTPIISILQIPDHIVLIFNDGSISMNPFQLTDKSPSGYVLEEDKFLQTNKQKQMEILFPFDYNLSSCFCVANKFLFSCGHWDYSFKVNVFQNNSIKVWKNYIREHNDVVTCMARDENNLVTATNLGQLNLWDISTLQLNVKTSKPELKHKLYGHLGRINSVDIDNEEGIIVSASVDKTVVLHSLQKGTYIRTIKFDEVPEIVKIVPQQGAIVTKCSSVYLYMHTYNGHLIRYAEVGYTSDMILSKNSEYMVAANGKAVTIRRLEDCKVVQKYEGNPTTVRCVTLSADQRYIFAGLESGELMIFPFDLLDEDL